MWISRCPCGEHKNCGKVVDNLWICPNRLVFLILGNKYRFSGKIQGKWQIGASRGILEFLLYNAKTSKKK